MNYESSGYSKKPPWFWLLVYLVVGGAVYAGYYYYAGYQKTPDTMMYASPAPADSSTSVTGSAAPAAMTAEGATEFKIAITDTGYSPSLLSIKVGDTITWTSSAAKPSNVSSDPHPSHTDYAPLNLGMFKPGESQTLTFDKAGTYKYHNHLNSTQTGTIIVK